MLCSEFKYLYTAVTRARNKLLLFDSNIDKRRHMFEYFKKLNLAEISYDRKGKTLVMIGKGIPVRLRAICRAWCICARKNRWLADL